MHPASIGQGTPALFLEPEQHIVYLRLLLKQSSPTQTKSFLFRSRILPGTRHRTKKQICNHAQHRGCHPTSFVSITAARKLAALCMRCSTFQRDALRRCAARRRMQAACSSLHAAAKIFLSRFLQCHEQYYGRRHYVSGRLKNVTPSKQ